MSAIDSLSGNVQNFANHLVEYYDHKELHGMINRLVGDITECTKWELTESEYFDAVEAAYYVKLDQIGY